jgi:hypothetical protein
MAKKRIVEKEPEFIVNAREPALGIGILKKKGDGTRTPRTPISRSRS